MLRRLNSKKVANYFEINPSTIIICYRKKMENYRTVNKHPGFPMRDKMIHRLPCKRVMTFMVKIRKEHHRK